jgi:hypothetical protein
MATLPTAARGEWIDGCGELGKDVLALSFPAATAEETAQVRRWLLQLSFVSGTADALTLPAHVRACLFTDEGGTTGTCWIAGELDEDAIAELLTTQGEHGIRLGETVLAGAAADRYRAAAKRLKKWWQLWR